MNLEPLNRHENIVFQFSGGKDSLVCLHLLREYLHRITVVWMNPGDPLPELRAQMERVKEICPKFVEIHKDKFLQIAAYGFPVDVLPLRNQAELQGFLEDKRAMPLQSFMHCCENNMWIPTHQVTKQLGATLVIRGQKNSDGHKGPMRSGEVADGVELFFPIEAWTDAEVLEFIKDNEFLPENFEAGNNSLECWDCTAYLAEHTWKKTYLEKHHPEKAAEVSRRVIHIKREVMKEFEVLEAYYV